MSAVGTHHKKILVLLILCSSVFPSCANLFIDNAISKYEKAAPQVKLGDSKERVLAILEPTQENLSNDQTKRPETFWLDKGSGVKSVVEVYFFRSGRVADGITTDNEFTPYVFTDDILSGIGWTVLGGPKTVARPRPTVVQPAQQMQCFQNGPFINCR